MITSSFAKASTALAKYAFAAVGLYHPSYPSVVPFLYATMLEPSAVNCA